MKNNNVESPLIRKVPPRTIHWNRAISLFIALAYLIISLLFAPKEYFLYTLFYLILPICCIWFGEGVGGYTGILSSPSITKATPGVFVVIAGWVLLLTPLFITLLSLLLDPSLSEWNLTYRSSGPLKWSAPYPLNCALYINLPPPPFQWPLNSGVRGLKNKPPYPSVLLS